MPTSHLSLGKRMTIAVLDIETTLDPTAAAIAGHRSGSLPIALQGITTACLLVAAEQADGTWTGFDLITLSHPMTEFEILMALDPLLASVAADGAILATYNGLAHDLPVIRRRAARHWMFGLPGLDALAKMAHIDLMLSQRGQRRDRAPSLREACAALGISAADPRSDTGTVIAPGVIKCQTDVVATLILGLFEIAIERGSDEPLMAGWEGLLRYLETTRPRAVHLEHFRSHPLLRAAKKARNFRPSERKDDFPTPSD